MNAKYFQLPIAGTQHLSSEFRKKRTCERNAWTRVTTLWPLVLQFVTAVGIVGLLIYVDGRHFNVTERSPVVPLPGGQTIRLNQYTPLQSDVTTFVSATLVVFRLAATAWASSLCWRSVFFLMGRSGLRRQELDNLISLGVFTPRSYFRDPFVFIIGVILLATISAPAASPILTGSITWISSSRRIEMQSDASISASVVADLQQWRGYSRYAPRREWTARQAAGLASIAWGRSAEKGVMKRVLPSTYGLNINSTIAKVTLPYFSVTALDWVADPMSLPESQRDVPAIIAKLSTYGAPRSLLLGCGALIPDSPWNSTSPPLTAGISERRLLIMTTHWRLDNNATGCFPDSSTIFNYIPSSIGLISSGNNCYAFAWVQYSAGAGVCSSCRVSSSSVVQNDTTLSLEQDAITIEALRLMADTTDVLVQMNASIPFSWGDDINDYIIAVLTRSYSGAWAALTNHLGRHSMPLTSRFSPSLPSLRAQVNLVRVYAWFGIQVLATSCGLIFMGMQFGTKHELIGDTTLVAFELDTTEVTTQDGRKLLREGELLKLEPKDGGWKVVVEGAEK